MDFELTSDQKNFQNLAKDFSDKELKPHAARWDKEEQFPLEAIQKAGRSKYGQEHDIRAMIDRKTGTISLERWTEVVEEVEDDATEMSIDENNVSFD